MHATNLYNILGNKTLNCIYEERLMSSIRNCGASDIESIKLFQFS